MQKTVQLVCPILHVHRNTTHCLPLSKNKILLDKIVQHSQFIFIQVIFRYNDIRFADFLTPHTIPEHVKDAADADSNVVIGSLWVRIAILGPVVILFFAGFIGLFIFWGPARYLYLFSVLAMILVWPLIEYWSVYTALEDAFCALEMVMAGVILACAFGPAKHLFCKDKKSNIRKDLNMS